MKTEIKKLAELRLLLNAAVAVLAYDPVLYDVDALLAGRKIALPLIDSALKLSGGVCHREIGLAKSLLGCKRREYGNVVRELAAAHLVAANTFCAHRIAREAIKLRDTIPFSAYAADAERRRANRYFAERRLPDPTL